MMTGAYLGGLGGTTRVAEFDYHRPYRVGDDSLLIAQCRYHY